MIIVFGSRFVLIDFTSSVIFGQRKTSRSLVTGVLRTQHCVVDVCQNLGLCCRVLSCKSLSAQRILSTDRTLSFRWGILPGAGMRL